MTIFERIRNVSLNGLYFVAVFLVAFAIATQALARRVNTYEATKQPLFFSIEKERVMVSNSVTGRVDFVAVDVGEHVRKGDLLVRISDDSAEESMKSLEALAAENLSARTELALLRAKIPDYEIRAPRDGVVYQIQAAEGSYLGVNASVMTLFADSDVKISGTVNQAQYAEMQSRKEMQVYSPRFEQIYGISFDGVGRVQSVSETEERYEVKFRFSDSNEGAAFIDGEGLEVVSSVEGDAASRPAARIANLWNKLILGH